MAGAAYITSGIKYLCHQPWIPWKGSHFPFGISKMGSPADFFRSPNKTILPRKLPVYPNVSLQRNKKTRIKQRLSRKTTWKLTCLNSKSWFFGGWFRSCSLFNQVMTSGSFRRKSEYGGYMTSCNSCSSMRHFNDSFRIRAFHRKSPQSDCVFVTRQGCSQRPTLNPQKWTMKSWLVKMTTNPYSGF